MALRSMVVRMRADNSAFNAGIKKSRLAIADFSSSVQNAKRHIRMMGDQLTESQRSNILRLAEKRDAITLEKQHEFARAAQAREAKHLADIIRELAAAENESIAISKEAEAQAKRTASAMTARSSAAGGNPLKEFASFAKLMKGGGAAVGFGIMLRKISDTADKAIELQKAIGRGEVSAKKFGVEMAKTVPIFGQAFALGEKLSKVIDRTAEIQARQAKIFESGARLTALENEMALKKMSMEASAAGDNTLEAVQAHRERVKEIRELTRNEAERRRLIQQSAKIRDEEIRLIREQEDISDAELQNRIASESRRLEFRLAALRETDEHQKRILAAQYELNEAIKESKSNYELTNEQVAQRIKLLKDIHDATIRDIAAQKLMDETRIIKQEDAILGGIRDRIELLKAENDEARRRIEIERAYQKTVDDIVESIRDVQKRRSALDAALEERNLLLAEMESSSGKKSARSGGTAALAMRGTQAFASAVASSRSPMNDIKMTIEKNGRKQIEMLQKIERALTPQQPVIVVGE